MGRWNDCKIWERKRIILEKYGTKTDWKNQGWVRQDEKLLKSINVREETERIRWESKYWLISKNVGLR